MIKQQSGLIMPDYQTKKALEAALLNEMQSDMQAYSKEK